MPVIKENAFDLALLKAVIFCESQSQKRSPIQSKKAVSKPTLNERAKDSPKNQILYVEANTDIREMTVKFLELEGYAVFSTDSAAEAEAHAGVARFDLYIVGDCIPLGSNLELIRRIKARDFYTPLILHSTQSYEADIERGKKAGAQAFIKKLGDFDYLLRKVRMLIG